MNPGHEAVVLAGELVALVDESATVRLFVRQSVKLDELYQRARGIVIVSQAADTAMRPQEVDCRWCGPCRSFHPRSSPAPSRAAENVRPEAVTLNGRDHPVDMMALPRQLGGDR